jgi:hypothetical protein
LKHVACKGDRRGPNRILVGSPKGKRQFEKHGCRLDDNIKMDLQLVGLGDIDWIDMAQDRDMWRALVNSVMNIRVNF